MKRYGAITALIPLLTLFFCIGLDNPFDPKGPGYEHPALTQFTVEFSTNGGVPSSIPSEMADSGAALGAKFPDNPSKDGSIFIGWFDEDDEQYTALSAIVKDVLLIAKWDSGDDTPPTVKPFDVAFFTNGGIPQTISTVTVDSGAALGAKFPDNPSKDGSIFIGWFDVDDEQYTALSAIVKNVLLIAEWDSDDDTPPAVTPFAVAFFTNGGIPQTIFPVIVDSGATLGSLYPANPTKAGHRFDGWFDEDSNQYDLSTIITKNISLSAKWTMLSYTLTVKMNPEGGGTFYLSPNNEQRRYLFSTEVTVTLEANEGYEFTGWSGASTSNNTEITVTMTRDTTLTANFKRFFIDQRDQQKYYIVKIGDLTWMARNLNYALGDYDDGQNFCYDYNPYLCEPYGRLYDWAAAQEACPAGWRLPDNNEWSNLSAAAGGSDNAGHHLKSSSSWNGIDRYGFGALPGGVYDVVFSHDPPFVGLSEYGQWWSADFSKDDDSGALWVMYSEDERLHDDIKMADNSTGNFAASIRCIQGTLPK